MPTDQPAADLLAKLAELKQKAASLADAAAAAKQPGTPASSGATVIQSVACGAAEVVYVAVAAP